MLFDPENPINQLCAQGMQLEGAGKAAEALARFLEAWELAASDLEKSIAAHYVARHQSGIAGKLQWDQIALKHALHVRNADVNAMYPSLYLNIAKCYEDLEDYVRAQEYYREALSYTHFLPEDGYGNMIRSGINSGLLRVAR